MSGCTLSLCMIARDEASNLPRCFASVEGLVDQIVVVDTGSKDNTVEVAKSFGAEVVCHPWTDSFSEARNRSLDLARGDWVLILDADDEFVREDASCLRELLSSQIYEAFFLQTINVLGINVSEGSLRHPTLRLFRNRPEYRYVGRIHESVIPSIVQRAGRQAIRVTGVRVRHYGYLKHAVEEKDKARRNLVLLEKELSSRQPDSFLFYNLGVEYMRVGDNCKALEYFNLAEQDIQWGVAFAPSLVRKKADCLAMLNRRNEALDYLERMAAIYPDYTDLFYQQGFLWVEERDFQRAIQAFTRCLIMQEPPNHYPTEEGVGGALAYRALGNIYDVILEKEKACEAFRRELMYNPRDIWPLGRIIGILLTIRSEEEVLAYLEACFNLVTPIANLGVANIFLNLYRPRPALYFLQQAAQLGAADDLYYALMGEALLLSGQREKAAVNLRRVGQQSSYYPRSIRNMFLLYCLQKDYSQALKLTEEETRKPVQDLYRHLCRRFTGLPAFRPIDEEMIAEISPVYMDILEKCLCIGDKDLVEKMLLLAETPGLATQAGKALYKHGWQKRAKQLLENGVEGGCQDEQAARILAHIARQDNDYEACVSWYNKALQWDPDSLEIYVEIARFYKEQALKVLTNLPGTAQATTALAGHDRPCLSLCMIVKNEQEYLPRCLSSVQGVVDEIIVVDTGSSDNTIALAKQFGARVFSFRWSGSFSAARNFAIDQACGDWILVMDADEELKPGDGRKIKALLAIDGVEGYCFHLINYYGPRAGCDYMRDLACRMFRNRPNYRFKRALHEQVIDQIVAAKGPGAVKVANVEILHYGYLNPVAAVKNKAERNLEIIKRAMAESPNDKFLSYSLGIELLNRGAYEEALTQLRRAWDPGRSYASDVVLKVVICLKELSRYDEALQLIEQAVHAYPNFTDLVFLQGEIYLQKGAYQEAVRSFQQCLELGDAPINYCGTGGMGGFRALYSLGKAYEGLGQIPEAITAYCRAVQDNPKFYLPLYSLASLWYKQYGPEEATRSMEAFFDLSKSTDLILLADVFMGTGDYGLAMGYLKKAKQTCTQSGLESERLAYMEGLCLAHLGCNPGAISCWKGISAGSPYYLSALAWCYSIALMAGDGEQAITFAKEIEAANLTIGHAYTLITGIVFGQVNCETSVQGHEEELCKVLDDLVTKCKSLGNSVLADRFLKIRETLLAAGKASIAKEGLRCN